MASIQLRNVPDDLYKEIAKMAEEQNRTIPQQTIMILKNQVIDLAAHRRRRKEVISSLKKNPLPPIDVDWVVEEIRKDRDSR